jgi:hypothetical protein
MEKAKEHLRVAPKTSVVAVIVQRSRPTSLAVGFLRIGNWLRRAQGTRRIQAQAVPPKVTGDIGPVTLRAEFIDCKRQKDCYLWLRRQRINKPKNSSLATKLVANAHSSGNPFQKKKENANEIVLGPSKKLGALALLQSLPCLLTYQSRLLRCRRWGC